MSTVNDIEAPASVRAGEPVKFPAVPYLSSAAYFDGYASELASAASSVVPAALDSAAAILLQAYVRDAGIFACGNGGSAAIANHLQCDHLKGVRTATDLRPRVVSLTTSAELLTAIANDIGYEDVFRYQLQSQARPDDVLVVVSSSGRSPNIVTALHWAREHDLRTIALTGFEGGQARALAEVAIHVDSTNYGIIEDLHQAIMHALAQYIRQSRMTAAMVESTVF